jgi:hypothetical protein
MELPLFPPTFACWVFPDEEDDPLLVVALLLELPPFVTVDVSVTLAGVIAVVDELPLAPLPVPPALDVPLLPPVGTLAVPVPPVVLTEEVDVVVEFPLPFPLPPALELPLPLPEPVEGVVLVTDVVEVFDD